MARGGREREKQKGRGRERGAMDGSAVKCLLGKYENWSLFRNPYKWRKPGWVEESPSAPKKLETNLDSIPWFSQS